MNLLLTLTWIPCGVEKGLLYSLSPCSGSSNKLNKLLPFPYCSSLYRREGGWLTAAATAELQRCRGDSACWGGWNPWGVGVVITASTLRAEVHARAPVESLVPILVCRVMGWWGRTCFTQCARALLSASQLRAPCLSDVTWKSSCLLWGNLVHSVVKIMKRM